MQHIFKPNICGAGGTGSFGLLARILVDNPLQSLFLETRERRCWLRRPISIEDKVWVHRPASSANLPLRNVSTDCLLGRRWAYQARPSSLMKQWRTGGPRGTASSSSVVLVVVVGWLRGRSGLVWGGPIRQGLRHG
jgi:hypothetical protein